MKRATGPKTIFHQRRSISLLQLKGIIKLLSVAGIDSSRKRLSIIPKRNVTVPKFKPWIKDFTFSSATWSWPNGAINYSMQKSYILITWHARVPCSLMTIPLTIVPLQRFTAVGRIFYTVFSLSIVLSWEGSSKSPGLYYRVVFGMVGVFQYGRWWSTWLHHFFVFCNSNTFLLMGDGQFQNSWFQYNSNKAPYALWWLTTGMLVEHISSVFTISRAFSLYNLYLLCLQQAPFSRKRSN